MLTHILFFFLLFHKNDHKTDVFFLSIFFLLQNEKQDVEAIVKEMEDNYQKLITESKKKSDEIEGCEKMVIIFHKL